MSSAINLFLHQCILRGGIPFSVEVPQYNKETIEAMKEAKAIANNPNIKGYDSIEELKKSIMEDQMFTVKFTNQFKKIIN